MLQETETSEDRPIGMPGEGAGSRERSWPLLAAVPDAMGMLAAALVAALLLAICYDVTVRYVFNAPTAWATELSTYGLVGIAFLGLGHAYLQGAHVRVELLVSRLSAASQRALSTAMAWIGLWYATVFLWRVTILVIENQAYGTRNYGLLNTPIYLPQILMVVGLIGLVAAFLHHILSASKAVPRPRMAVAAAVGAVAVAAVAWLGLQPPPFPDTRFDWSSVVIFGAWLIAMWVWSGPRVASLACLPLTGVALLMVLAQDAALGGVLLALALAIVVMLGLGLPVAIALGTVGLAGIYILIPLPSLTTLAERGWSSLGSFTLTAIPMFVLMGSVLMRSGISTDLFDAFMKWLGRLPGGLAFAGVGACSIFSAVSGSSLATASTIGMVACPEMDRRRYDPRLNFGAIAAGGTLGILIPPSIAMIIYASIVGVPVTRMFIAGILPGLMLTAGLMAVILAWAMLRPGAAPRDHDHVPWRVRIRAAQSVVPVLVLIVGVLGALYAGVATPTEAAAVGALGAYLLCAHRGRLNWATVRHTLIDTAKVTSFLLFIVIGASVLSYIFDFIRLATELVQAVEAAGLGRWATLALIGLLYLVLGMFIDPISMMVMTLPVVYPLMAAMGFDPIWFGVLIVVLIEIGLITPPVGMNLYILKGVNPDARTRDIILGTLPFLAVIFAGLGALVAFPEIALWLPATLD